MKPTLTLSHRVFEFARRAAGRPDFRLSRRFSSLRAALTVLHPQNKMLIGIRHAYLALKEA